MIDYSILTAAISDNVCAAIENHPAFANRSRLAGFALFTDNNLTSFSVVFCDIADVQDEGDDLLFRPEEWDFELKKEFSNPVCHLWQQWTRHNAEELDLTAEFDLYSVECFKAISNAVPRIRQRCGLSEHVFATAHIDDEWSTQSHLEEQLIDSVNSAATCRRRLECKLEFAQSWLSTIEYFEGEDVANTDEIKTKLKKDIAQTKRRLAQNRSHLKIVR
ncbi:MAG: hypothetical protein JXX14_21785 [Deltaproteobacteria bacterium]|nr:hypothetical protein [Deltaproteobacteria bacterium]